MNIQGHSVFITGVSSGIGLSLAQRALDLGYKVYGTSRRRPDRLLHNRNFRFASIDLLQLDLLEQNLEGFLNLEYPPCFDFVFLNAGSFGSRPSRGEDNSLDAFKDIFSLNLHSNKIIIDYFMRRKLPVKNYVVSSSIASVRQRAGMLAYASSKAALNAMISVYALENRDIFFALLGLCNVDTKLAKTIMDVDETFPELFELKKRARQTGYIVSPDQRAANIFKVILNREEFGLKSGVFTEIRSLLSKQHAA